MLGIRWPLLVLTSALWSCGSRQDLIIGSDEFRLERRDEFDALDLSYWELATHTFDPNLAWFNPDNAKVEDGHLVLSITADAAASEPTKAYSAAEVRTRVPFLYGRFRTRARLARGTGVISAFWGFYDRYSNDTGEQIDNQIVIESAIAQGASDQQLRFTVDVPSDAPESATQTGFDADEFHELGYDWTPTEVRFFVDGQEQSRVSGDAAAQLTQYERLILSAYPTGAGWVSPFDPEQLPLTADFDWVEVYSYAPGPP